MKKTFYFLPLLCLCVLLSGCSKEETNGETVESGLTLETTEVNTYQMVTLNAENMILSDSYNGTFGSESITILKTSESTLSFVVPPMASGNYNFSFELLEETIVTVTETVVDDTAEFIADIFSDYDAEMAVIDETIPEVTPEEIALNNTYKTNLQSYVNSLSDSMKAQLALYYKANIGMVTNFKSNLFYTLDASVSARQSDCPEVTEWYLDYFYCTATNLTEILQEFNGILKNSHEMLAMSGPEVFLSNNPAYELAGLSEFGELLATTVHVYFLSMIPAWEKFDKDLRSFMASRWVMLDDMFYDVTTEYQSDEFVDLNLDPVMRTIREEDDLSFSEELTSYMNEFLGLEDYWYSVEGLLGERPGFYFSNQEVVLFPSIIEISNISDSRVELIDQEGETVKFHADIIEELDISFDITVTYLNAFVHTKTVNTIIKPGNYLMDNWLVTELVLNGTPIYTDQWSQFYDTCFNGQSYVWNDIKLGGSTMVFTENSYTLNASYDYIYYNVDDETCSPTGTTETSSVSWNSIGDYSITDNIPAISNSENDLFFTIESASIVPIDVNHIEFTEVALQNEEVGPPTQHTLTYKLERQ